VASAAFPACRSSRSAWVVLRRAGHALHGDGGLIEPGWLTSPRWCTGRCPARPVHRFAAAVAELVRRALWSGHFEIADAHQAFENVFQQDVHDQMSPQSDHPVIGLECRIESAMAHRPRPIDAPRCNVHKIWGVEKFLLAQKSPGRRPGRWSRNPGRLRAEAMLRGRGLEIRRLDQAFSSPPSNSAFGSKKFSGRALSLMSSP